LIIRTIGDVYDRYIADPKHAWSKRTAIAHTTTRKWVVEAFGEATSLNEITREACREFVELLRNMPAHADKRFPKLPMREAVAAAKLSGEQRLINAANVNAYINRFGGVMNWAMNEGYIDRNKRWPGLSGQGSATVKWIVCRVPCLANMGRHAGRGVARLE
tara:strand:- start:57 stop:539 length:483 start_codon:yes stop_codon:yes gene_type:complete